MSAPDPAPDKQYQSNPFLNAAAGLRVILEYNAATAMLNALVILGVIFALYGILAGGLILHSVWSVIVGFLIYMVGLMLLVPYMMGMMAAVSGSSLREQSITLREASRRATAKLGPMLLMGIVVYLGTSAGLMFFIVPGLMFAARASLAPLFMLEEDLGPMTAIDRSIAATKGHTMEMLGSMFASMLMGGGFLLAPAMSMAPLVGRYDDIRRLATGGGEKPKTHWLNYGAVVLAVVLIAGFVALYTWIVLSTINQVQQQVKTQAQAKNSPSPSPALGIVTTQAFQTSDSWSLAVQQGRTAAAYALEDPTYQKKNSPTQQATDTKSLVAPAATRAVDSSFAGVRGDGKTQMVVVVYKTTTAAGTPYYLEVEVQRDQDQWLVWGYKTSATVITPTVPQ